MKVTNGNSLTGINRRCFARQVDVYHWATLPVILKSNQNNAPPIKSVVVEGKKEMFYLRL